MCPPAVTTVLLVRSPGVTVTDAPPLDVAAPRLSWRRMAGVLLAVAVAALAVAALPGLGEVRERLSAADPRWVAAVAALELASCLSFVAAYRGVMCSSLPWRLSYRLAMATQGTNVLLPTGGAGGLAVSAWGLRRAGMAPARIARRTVALFVATSSVNFVTALLAGALLAAGLLPGGVDPLLAAAPAVAALVVMALVAAAPRLLDRADDRLPGRLTAAGAAALARGIRDAGALLRSGRPAVAGGAVGYMGFDLLALAAAFEAIGTTPALGVLLLAYPLGQLGGLLPLPGGLGGTDGGLIAAFVLLGAPLAATTAAVLLYRVFQLGFPVLLGAPAITTLPRAVRRWPGAAQRCEPEPHVPVPRPVALAAREPA